MVEEDVDEKASSKKHPAPQPQLKVRKNQLEKAIRALLQVVAKQSANKAAELGAKALFGAASKSFHITFHLTWMPEKKKFNPRLLPLPHAMYTSDSEVCFLCKDSCKKRYKELLVEKKQVPGVSKVIQVEKLQKQYKQGSDRKALRDAFDLFICDVRIYHMMWELLGVYFKSGNKYPIPIKIRDDQDDPTPKIEKAMSSTLFRPTEGTTSTVKFGRSDMTEEALVENACAVIKRALPYFADNPVQKISVQAHEAPALPIWSRPKAEGHLNLKKHREKQSASSETASSGGSEVEDTTSSAEITSDAGETISVDLSTGEATSDLDIITDAQSDLDTQTGDDAEGSEVSKDDVPLVKSPASKKRKKDTAQKAAARKTPKVTTEDLPPPAAKGPASKKRKAAAR